MTTWIKQSTAITFRFGPFLDKADGVTEKTALSLAATDIQLSKNHGAWANKNSSTAPGHDSNGWYTVALNATDTDTLGPLKVKCDDAATFLPVWETFNVVPAAVYDALIGGTATLPADMIKANGSATAAAAIASAASTMVSLTVGASSTTTVVNTNLTETTNDHYKDRWLIFITGACAGQAKQITAYNGGTKALTVGTLTDAPANTDTAIIV